MISLGSLLSVSSCSSDDDEVEVGKKYTVAYNTMGSNSAFDVDLTLFEYNDNNEKINSQSWNAVKENQTKTFTSAPQATKVKVYLKMSTKYLWIQQVYYLTGKNPTITIKDDTMTGSKEP